MAVDYSQTINRYTLHDAYLLPKIDKIITQIAKGSIYSTLDLKLAYNQIPLPSQDHPYTAFEACGKLHQHTRLPFGVTKSVSFFQQLVDELIEKYKLSGTFAYLDNVTVSGVNKSDHDIKLNALLNAAKSEGWTFNDSKCVYCRTEMDLLGYRVTYNIIRSNPERLRPLLEMKCPNSKSELRRVIGMFSYYAKWVHNLSQKIRPLIQANLSSSFPLSEKSLTAFHSVRKELCSACLTCIKEGVPFVVECDASDHTLGATFNQRGQPVAFHSQTFTPTEFRYHTVEKKRWQ